MAVRASAVSAVQEWVTREAGVAAGAEVEVVMVEEAPAAREARVGRSCVRARPRLPLSLDVAFSWASEDRVASAAKRATHLRAPLADPTAPLYRSVLDR